MKSILSRSFFSFLLLLSVQNQAKNIILTSPGLSIIDGASWGINEYVIANIQHIGAAIKKLQVGTKDPQEEKNVGNYTYNNKKYTLLELVELEKTGSKEEVDFLRKALVEKVRNSISAITEPFMKNANDIKEYMVQLIDDSCTKRDRRDSELLSWAQQKKGSELLYFQEHLNTFSAINIFCNDLLTFLTDLVRSCPKAFAKYQEVRRKFDQKHT